MDRGVKESITVPAPIFVVFIITHVILLGYGIFNHVGDVKSVVIHVNSGIAYDISSIGFAGIVMLFFRTYSMGGGYSGFGVHMFFNINRSSSEAICRGFS